MGRLLFSALVVLGLVRMPLPTVSDPLTHPTWSRPAAASYLNGRQIWWSRWPRAQRDGETFCVSCHTSLPYALSRSALAPATDDLGPTRTETRLLENVRARVRAWDQVGPYYRDEDQGVPKTRQSRGTEAVLNAVVLASLDRGTGAVSDDTRLAFAHLWTLQLDEGDDAGAWSWLHFDLEPWEDDGGAFWGASLVALALERVPDREAVADGGAVERLRAYLARRGPEQDLFNRLTAAWATAGLPGAVTEEERSRLVEEALALQREDGSWSLSTLGRYTRRDGTDLETAGDGYATGLAVLGLRGAGLTAEHPALVGALAWLARSQDPVDGSWPGYSLNRDRDPLSETGRFMRDAATAHAALALAVGS